MASARAGNVIGGGDWSEDRLIPDAVRAWQAGKPLQVRRPQAVRPWQHVLEPLAGYLTLAQRLWQQPALAGAYNFGPQANEAVTVREWSSWRVPAYGEARSALRRRQRRPAGIGMARARRWQGERSASRELPLVQAVTRRWRGTARSKGRRRAATMPRRYLRF